MGEKAGSVYEMPSALQRPDCPVSSSRTQVAPHPHRTPRRTTTGGREC